MKTSNKDKAKSLQAYYSETTDARAERISKILMELIPLKVKFPNRTKLSEYVAKKLSEEEGQPVASSTIRRNKKYDDILIKYLVKVSPETVAHKKDLAIEFNIVQRSLQKQIEEKELIIKELTRKLNEADALLEKRLALEYSEKYSIQKSRVEKIEVSGGETYEDLFNELYKLILKLEYIKFELKDGVIYDWESDEAIISKSKFPKFFKWLAKKI
ncbi:MULTISPECIES: hypothetical protein [Aeromonas]|uniref:hypothetical protein n=1 Tax=Aeromonas TaxID=642 RepID=UPI001303D8AF|nr:MULTISPECIES: hypothetical protein [Aeromonas]QGZ74124.1 hypothetical protein GQR50_17175 [Aeromonas hydrophila]